MRTTDTIDQPATKRPRAAKCPTQEVARRLAVERGHLGVTNSLLQHAANVGSTPAGTALWKMAISGELHGVQVPGVPKHWFANAELAQRWQARPTVAPKAAAVKPKPKPAVLARGRPAPVVIGAPANTIDKPARVPASVTFEICPSPTHDARYHCAPGEQPFGAGFAQAGIGRDAVTGMAWGAAA